MSNHVSEVYAAGEVLRRLGDGAVEFYSAKADNLLKRVRHPDVSDLYDALAANASLVSVALVITDDTLEGGVTAETSAVTVTATYADSSTRDVTAECTFSTNDPEVATVDEDGTVTGIAEGTATITANYRGLKSGTDTVTVTDPA